MEPISLTAALIMVGASLVSSVGTSLIGGIFQGKENEKARNEAKMIAAQNRKDILAENSRNNVLATRASKLSDKELSFQNDMFKEYKKDKNLEKASAIADNKNALMRNTSQNLLGISDEDLALKSRLIRRGL